MFFEKRTENEGDKQFKVFRMKYPVLMPLAWYLVAGLFVVGIAMDWDVLGVVALVILLALLIAVIMDGEQLRYNRFRQRMRGKEYRTRGKAFNTENPPEYWVEV